MKKIITLCASIFTLFTITFTSCSSPSSSSSNGSTSYYNLKAYNLGADGMPQKEGIVSILKCKSDEATDYYIFYDDSSYLNINGNNMIGGIYTGNPTKDGICVLSIGHLDFMISYRAHNLLDDETIGNAFQTYYESYNANHGKAPNVQEIDNELDRILKTNNALNLEHYLIEAGITIQIEGTTITTMSATQIYFAGYSKTYTLANPPIGMLVFSDMKTETTTATTQNISGTASWMFTFSSYPEYSFSIPKDDINNSPIEFTRINYDSIDWSILNRK